MGPRSSTTFQGHRGNTRETRDERTKPTGVTCKSKKKKHRWWVVDLPLRKIMEFARWDDDIPNRMESHKTYSKAPSRSCIIDVYLYISMEVIKAMFQSAPPKNRDPFLGSKKNLTKSQDQGVPRGSSGFDQETPSPHRLASQRMHVAKTWRHSALRPSPPPATGAVKPAGALENSIGIVGIVHQ